MKHLDEAIQLVSGIQAILAQDKPATEILEAMPLIQTTLALAQVHATVGLADAITDAISGLVREIR